MITSFSPLSQTLRFYGNVLDDGSPSTQGTLLCVNGTGPALLDHNTFTAHHGADEVIHINGQGASDASGWTTDVIPGGPNAVFLEDNSFVFTAQAFNGGSCSSGSPCYFWGTSAFEAYYGARVVARHNTLNMMQMDVHGSCSAIYGRWWEIYDNTWITIANSNQSSYTALRGGSGVLWGNTLTDGGNLVTGKLEVTEDCSSGSYPITDQIGRGISQNLSPAYIWGNSSSMGILDGNTTYVQLNRDYYTSSSQPTTLNFCENAANVATGCPVATVYTPYVYPHPLTASSGGVGGGANTILTGNTFTEADAGSGHYIGNGISVSGVVANNSLSYTDNGFEQGTADAAPYATTLANNHIHHIMASTDPANDSNAIHAECYSYIYNNMIHDLNSASSAMLLEPRCNLANGTYAYYTWNNVAWNVGTASPFVDETNRVNVSDLSNYFHYNETLVPSGTSGEAAACIRADNSSGVVNEIAAFNIHCMTTPARGGNLSPIICGSETTGCVSPASTVLATYVLQTPWAAAAQGYTAANFFAPTSGGATIAAGTNEESAATGPLASLAGDRLGVVRPLTAAWDAGAYEFVATGGPVTLAPSSYAFTPAPVGSASSDSPQAFTLTNSSGATITVTSVSFTGADPGDFSAASSCGTQINGSTCTINVTFLPTAAGARTATLSVAFTGASGSPLTVSLSGAGVAPIITSPNTPIIFASARSSASPRAVATARVPTGK